MKILGISTKSVEQVEAIMKEDNVKIMTFAEFYNRKEDFDNAIVVDQLSKLNLILGLEIIDMKLYQNKWIRKDFELTSLYILSRLSEQEEVKEVEYQHRYIPDFNLNEFSFISHITEYQMDQYNFLNKVHNILSRTQKEVFDCSDKYKELLREKLLNKEMSELYQKYLDKEKGIEYPPLFKFIATIRRRQYKPDEIPLEEESIEE